MMQESDDINADDLFNLQGSFDQKGFIQKLTTFLKSDNAAEREEAELALVAQIEGASAKEYDCFVEIGEIEESGVGPCQRIPHGLISLQDRQMTKLCITASPKIAQAGFPKIWEVENSQEDQGLGTKAEWVRRVHWTHTILDKKLWDLPEVDRVSEEDKLLQHLWSTPEERAMVRGEYQKGTLLELANYSSASEAMAKALKKYAVKPAVSAEGLGEAEHADQKRGDEQSDRDHETSSTVADLKKPIVRSWPTAIADYIYREDPLRFWVAVLIMLGVIALFVPPLAAIILPGFLLSALWIHIAGAVVAALTAFFSSHALMAFCDYVGLSQWVHDVAKFLQVTDRGIAFWLAMVMVSVPALALCLVLAGAIIGTVVSVITLLVPLLFVAAGGALSTLVIFAALGVVGIILQVISKLGIPVADRVLRSENSKGWHRFWSVVQLPFFALKKIGTVLCDISLPILKLCTGDISAAKGLIVALWNSKISTSKTLAKGMAADLLAHRWTSESVSEALKRSVGEEQERSRDESLDLPPRQEFSSYDFKESIQAEVKLAEYEQHQQTLLDHLGRVTKDNAEVFWTTIDEKIGDQNYYEILCQRGSYDVILQAWEWHDRGMALYSVPERDETVNKWKETIAKNDHLTPYEKTLLINQMTGTFSPFTAAVRRSLYQAGRAVFYQRPGRLVVSILLAFGVASLFVPPLAMIIWPSMAAISLGWMIASAVGAFFTMFITSQAFFPLIAYCQKSYQKIFHAVSKMKGALIITGLCLVLGVPGLGLILGAGGTALGLFLGLAGATLGIGLAWMGVGAGLALGSIVIGGAGLLLQGLAWIGWPLAWVIEHCDHCVAWQRAVQKILSVLLAPFVLCKAIGVSLANFGYLGFFAALKAFLGVPVDMGTGSPSLNTKDGIGQLWAEATENAEAAMYPHPGMRTHEEKYDRMRFDRHEADEMRYTTWAHRSIFHPDRAPPSSLWNLSEAEALGYPPTLSEKMAAFIKATPSTTPGLHYTVFGKLPWVAQAVVDRRAAQGNGHEEDQGGSRYLHSL